MLPPWGAPPTAVLPFAAPSLCPRCGSHLWFNDVAEGEAPTSYELMPGLFDAARGWPLRSEIYIDRAFDSARLAGADPGDPVPMLMAAATAADVADTVVGGRHVVRGGAHAALDVAADLRAAITAVDPCGTC